jgi:hypothetical protein
LFQFKSDGLEIFMVADRHSTDIDSVARLIAQVLNTGAAFTNTAGSGVATLSDSNTITVTVPTNLEGM